MILTAILIPIFATSLELVELKSFTYPIDARIAMAKLEAAEIKCFLRNELTTQVNNFYSNAIGGVKLMVNPKDLDVARLILAEEYNWDIEELQQDESLENNEIVCIKCGSTNVGEPRLNGSWALVSTLLMGFPLPFIVKKAHCFSCGAEFRIKS